MWRWVPILVVAFLTAVLAGTYTADLIRNTSKVPPPPTILSIADSELHIGSIHETSKYTHQLHVKNTSQSRIVIERFENSCNCLSINPNRSVTLPPGEVQSFELSIRATPEPTEKVSSVERHRSVGLTAVCTSEGQERRVDWEITFQIIPTIRVEPGLDRFGRHSVVTGGLVRRATIHLTDNIKSVEVAPSREWDVRLIPTPTATDAKTVLQLVAIALHPKTPRIIDDTITLTPISRDGVRLPTITLRLVGELSSDVVFTPEVLHFGRVAVGERVTDTVRLASLTDSQFQVLEVRDLPPGWRAEKSEYDERVWTISALVSQPDEQKHTLRFVIRDHAGHKTDLQLPAVYLGFQPKMGGP